MINLETLKTLEEELEFLKYFLENIINDSSIQQIIENQITKGEKPDEYILNFINVNDIQKYIEVIEKYSEDIFNFELGEWYKAYIETKKYRYLIDEYFIEFYFERITYNILFIKLNLKEDIAELKDEKQRELDEIAELEIELNEILKTK